MHSKRPISEEKSSERISKRTRVEKEPSETSKLPSYVAEKTLVPLGPCFVGFFPLKDVTNVFQTSRAFRSFSQSNQVWYALLESHFRRPYIRKDSKYQYQAEYLLAKAEQAPWWTRAINYGVLRQHVEKLHTQETQWTYYYFARVSQYMHMPHSPVDYGLQGMRKVQDPNLKSYLANYFTNFDYTGFFNVDQITAFLALENPETSPVTPRQHCLIQCVMTAHPTYRGDRVKLKKEQLATALNLGRNLNPGEFQIFWVDVLKSLRLLTPEKAEECKDEIGEASNQLEIVMHAAVFRVISNDNVVKKVIELWLKALTDTHPAACFHYAKRFLSPNEQPELTKNYFMRAMNGGERRAFREFYYLFTSQQRVVRKAEYDHYLILAGKLCDDFAICLITREKNWERNLTSVWLALNYITMAPDICKLEETLIKLGKKIEKAGLLVRCALTFIHALDENWEEARRQYGFAVSGNPAIFNTFLAHGKTLGLYSDEHQRILTQLQPKPVKQTTNHKTSHRMATSRKQF